MADHAFTSGRLCQGAAQGEPCLFGGLSAGPRRVRSLHRDRSSRVGLGLLTARVAGCRGGTRGAGSVSRGRCARPRRAGANDQSGRAPSMNSPTEDSCR